MVRGRKVSKHKKPKDSKPRGNVQFESKLRRDLSTYVNDTYDFVPFWKLRNLVYLDSQVASLWNTRLTGLSLDYEIISNNSDPIIYEFIKNQFERFSMFEVAKLCMNAIAFGFACLELTWDLEVYSNMPCYYIKNIDFLINEHIEIKDDRVSYTSSGVGNSSTGKQELNYFKYLLLVNGKEHGGGGFPLFTTVWKEYERKEVATYYHQHFIELLTGSIVTIKSKTGETTQIEDANILQQVASADNCYAVLHPDTYDIEVKELLSKDTTNNAFLRAKEYADMQIAKLILGQTLTTQSGTTGSYAISRTHQEVREDYATADRRYVEEGFAQLIRKVVDLNFGEQKFYPEFRYIEKFDEGLRLQRDIKLSKEFNIKFTQEYFKKVYRLGAEDIIIGEV
ncbi:phage portal protein family protein [Candidatus Borreliella tachyglossi]|uniref:phage portal protein family protein n=1 Tax=Candidatus Borreliella tachyglossi TaxID=1964448 RepID=UPI0040429013